MLIEETGSYLSLSGQFCMCSLVIVCVLKLITKGTLLLHTHRNVKQKT